MNYPLIFENFYKHCNLIGRMIKRGQVTIFVILAILIVGVIAAFFLLRKPAVTGSSLNTSGVVGFVNDCVKSTGIDGIYFIGGNGGYYNLPSFYALYGIPYYYSNGTESLPSLNSIENSISDYVDNSLDFCVGNFSKFSGFNISSGNVSTKTRIYNGGVIMNVNYPITIRKGNESEIIKNFDNIQIPMRVFTVYNVSSQIINSSTGGNGLCLSCIYNLGNENGVSIDMTNINEGILFEIVDNESNLKGEPLDWKFVYGY